MTKVQSYIAAAAELGCKAKTLKGAGKFVLARTQNRLAFIDATERRVLAGATARHDKVYDVLNRMRMETRAAKMQESIKVDVQKHARAYRAKFPAAPIRPAAQSKISRENSHNARLIARYAHLVRLPKQLSAADVATIKQSQAHKDYERLRSLPDLGSYRRARPGRSKGGYRARVTERCVHKARDPICRDALRRVFRPDHFRP